MRAESRSPAPQDGTYSIELGGQRIAYRLQRSKRRRSLALLVDEDGLRVRVPLHAQQRAIDALLREHAAWVLRKVGDWQNRRQPWRWTDGTPLMYLGAPLPVVLTPGTTQPRLEQERIEIPAEDSADVEAALRTWLQQQALIHFTQRCHDYSRQLGLPLPAVGLSNARTRWGSCHARGRIRIHWRLIQAPGSWGDYVAAHEVAHLREMNHSPAFWRTVAALVPDHIERRAALRRDAHRYLLL